MPEHEATPVASPGRRTRRCFRRVDRRQLIVGAGGGNPDASNVAHRRDDPAHERRPRLGAPKRTAPSAKATWLLATPERRGRDAQATNQRAHGGANGR